MCTPSSSNLEGQAAWLSLEPYELSYHREQFDHPMRYTVAVAEFLRRTTPMGHGESWSVRDDGTGAGASLKWLAQDFPTCKFDGFDINSTLIDMGRSRLADEGSVSLAVGDATVGGEPRSYDLCLSQQLISWLQITDAETVLRRQMIAARHAVLAVGLFTTRSADYLMEVADHVSGKVKPITVLGLDTVTAWACDAGWMLSAHEDFEMDFELADHGRARDIHTLRCGDRTLSFAGDVYMPWGIVLLERG